MDERKEGLENNFDDDNDSSDSSIIIDHMGYDVTEDATKTPSTMTILKHNIQLIVLKTTVVVVLITFLFTCVTTIRQTK